MFNLFSANHLVANARKCHFLTNSKMLVRLDFDFHAIALFSKANEKASALA